MKSNNIVVNNTVQVVQKNITIVLDDITLSKLNYILNTLNIKHLPGYWTLQKALENKKIPKNDLVYSQAFMKSCIPVLEHIKRQISRFYIFNIIETKLNNQQDTDLNRLLSDFMDIISIRNNVLTEEIISKLLISNLNSIFNKYSNQKLEHYYNVTLLPQFDDNCINKDYINGALEYVSNYDAIQVNVNIENETINKKTRKI